MHYVEMGVEDASQRLQASIRHGASPLQRSCRIPRTGGVGPGVAGGNFFSGEQKRNTNSATRADTRGFLFEVFSGPKERRELFTSHTGPPFIEQIPQKIQVSHAHTYSSHTTGAQGRLVHVNRPERRLFSHSHLSPAQKISAVRISGHSVRIRGAPVWPVTESEGVCEMCRGCHSSSQGTGHSPGHLSGRLATVSAFRAGGCGTHGRCVETLSRSGFCGEQGKECPDAETEYNLPGSCVRLSDPHCPPVGRKSGHVQIRSLSLYHSKARHVRAVSTFAGIDGVSTARGETWQAVHERVPALGGVSQAGPCASQAPRCDSDGFMRPRAPTLETTVFPDDGCTHGHRFEQKSGDNGGQFVGLGRRVRGQGSKWGVGHTSSSCPYKLPGAFGSVSDTEVLSAVSPRAPCACENRQHDHGGVHQPSGWFTIPTVAHFGTQTDFVERCAPSLCEGDARPRDSELRGGPALQGQPPLRGVVTSPDCSGSDLDTVRARGGGSLCVTGELALPNVLLPARRGRTTRGGCVRTRVATHPPLCVSSPGSDSLNIVQSEGRSSVTDFDCASLAVHALAGRREAAPLRSPVASPTAQGSPLPSTGTGVSPSPRAPRSMGLAREWFNLSHTGLSPGVIETIQNARASSTRSLYDCKWKVFEEWCANAQEVPFQCSVGAILSFLQDMIDKKKAFSTIKVYLAAISACHVGFDSKPVGQHPLICRFMKGARRRLPVSKPMSPPWDLGVVLDALTSHPFEPLKHIDLKVLSLKVALLLALATAKRVSDIHALSVNPACMRFAPGISGVSLKPNPAFVPKVGTSCCQVDLQGFQLPPHSSTEQQQLHLLCPVRALHTYVERTRDFRKGDQLFVSWAKPHFGKRITKQRLSHWIVDAIALAYSSSGLQPPAGLRAHSTRGLATSWALFNGVSIQDICAAASWSSPLTFVRFYRLDVTSQSLSHAVLSVGSSEGLMHPHSPK